MSQTWCLWQRLLNSDFKLDYSVSSELHFSLFKHANVATYLFGDWPYGFLCELLRFMEKTKHSVTSFDNSDTTWLGSYDHLWVLNVSNVNLIDNFQVWNDDTQMAPKDRIDVSCSEVYFWMDCNYIAPWWLHSSPISGCCHARCCGTSTGFSALPKDKDKAGFEPPTLQLLDNLLLHLSPIRSLYF